MKDEETGEVIGYVIELDGKSATFSLVADLKALVFQPAFYYQGIEQWKLSIDRCTATYV